MNILQYESKIWATADLLRGCGIKESEWPSFMMPFFALVMIESRLVRMFDDLKTEIEESDTLLKIYDCTCGGGNMLFGVEDRINQKFKRLPVSPFPTFPRKQGQGQTNRCASFTLSEYFEQYLKPFIASLDYKEQPLVVTTSQGKYFFDNERETLIQEAAGKQEDLSASQAEPPFEKGGQGGFNSGGVAQLLKSPSIPLFQRGRLGVGTPLGCGKIVVKATLKNASKTQPERIEISVELAPDYQKDYEIIPFRKDAVANQAAIAAFMAKYISKPFEYLENVVGVEINFNKIFYQPEKLREVGEILGEIAALGAELKALEADVNETVTRGLDKTVAMKDSGIEWIGKVPAHWAVRRIKDLSILQSGNIRLCQSKLKRRGYIPFMVVMAYEVIFQNTRIMATTFPRTTSHRRLPRRKDCAPRPHRRHPQHPDRQAQGTAQDAD